MASTLCGKGPETAGRRGLQEGRGLVYHTCVDRMPVRQRVEEAGFPSNLAQVPDFHRLIYGGCGQEPVTARVQGHMGHLLFVHSQIPKLPAIHVQQDHVPHIVSRDHHSAFDRYVQAAEPDAGGRDCAVRLLGTEASCIYSLLQLMSHAQQTVNKYPLSE